MAFQFNCPENVWVVGPSGSGKSTFVEKMCDTPWIWTEPPEKIYLFYGIDSSSADNIRRKHPEAIVSLGVPRNLDQPSEIFDKKVRELVLFDDLAQELNTSPHFTTLLIRGSHHLNLTVVKIDHFLYANQREHRLQAQNYHVAVLFKNPKAVNQIKHYVRNMSVGDSDTVIEAYKDVHKTPFHHLVLDMRHDIADERLRIMSNIFREDGDPQWLYL